VATMTQAAQVVSESATWPKQWPARATASKRHQQKLARLNLIRLRPHPPSFHERRCFDFLTDGAAFDQPKGKSSGAEAWRSAARFPVMG
jgi:hypothetical protein